jgi:AAA15 family ATPase/GTPase
MNNPSVPNNIELLYVYIDDYINLQKLSLNFSGDLNFELMSGEAGRPRLRALVNAAYPKGIFPIESAMKYVEVGTNKIINDATGISSITAIIGENGSGKSNILRLLMKILTDDLYHDHEVCIILRVDGVLKGYHSFRNKLSLSPDSSVAFDLNHSVSTFSRTEAYVSKNTPKKDQHFRIYIPEAEFMRVVYYSPIADLQSIPYNVESKRYSDISTNFLLEFDCGKGEAMIKNNFDKVLSHKSQSIRRFMELMKVPPYFPKEIQDFIPSETGIQINRIYHPTSTRNLTPEDKSFLKNFDSLFQREWSIVGDLRNKGKKDYYQKLLIVELSHSITNHFFQNKEDVYAASLDIITEELDWKAPISQIIISFFKKQKWIGNSGALIYFYETIINAINLSDYFNELGESFTFFINSGESVNSAGKTSKSPKHTLLEQVYEAYTDYENLFIRLGTNHPSGLLDFKWRELSSGEKALLDLFARLVHLRSRSFANVNDNDYQIPDIAKLRTIILLIDEGESGFHPQWQKRFLKYLTNFLVHDYARFNVQIIVTSHSPFLISDLPRENVIFLEKDGKKVKVLSSDHFNLTFGGNIHEMLMDSFFLQDGVVGEFAREKINDVIKEIQKKEKIEPQRISELKRFILTIGEPVIRVKLLALLNEKKLIDAV